MAKPPVFIQKRMILHTSFIDRAKPNNPSTLAVKKRWVSLVLWLFKFPCAEKSLLYARFTCWSPFNLKETPKQKHLQIPKTFIKLTLGSFAVNPLTPPYFLLVFRLRICYNFPISRNHKGRDLSAHIKKGKHL